MSCCCKFFTLRTMRVFYICMPIIIHIIYLNAEQLNSRWWIRNGIVVCIYIYNIYSSYLLLYYNIYIYIRNTYRMWQCVYIFYVFVYNVYMCVCVLCVSVGEQHRVAFGYLFFTFRSVLRILANGLSVGLKTTLLKNLRRLFWNQNATINNNNKNYIIIFISLSLYYHCVKTVKFLSGCVYAFKSS